MDIDPDKRHTDEPVDLAAIFAIGAVGTIIIWLVVYVIRAL